MYFLRKTDCILFDGGEDELENEWSFTSKSGKQVLVSVDRFITHPLHSLQEHLWETADFDDLIKALDVRKNEGIAGNYCNSHGMELFWIEEPFNKHQPVVIVSFGEVNPGRYRLEVEAEIGL